ncbi:MAG: stage II sporulation protein P [Clostridiales bacterium]|jgi:stage II sporulation protein P|nr:stage II sporulation protein P [Clostridiales bacterium]MDR2750109.1 stage II sporulation protein P [Clostridiales bacterium]
MKPGIWSRLSGIAKPVLFGLLVAAVVILALEYCRRPNAEDQEREEYNSNPLPEETEPLIAPFYPTINTIELVETMADKLKYLYAIEDGAYVTDADLDIKGGISMNMESNLSGPDPKVLIFHTHSMESYKDAVPGSDEGSVVGLGRLLAWILAEEYNVMSVHDSGKYDVVDGKEHRDGSYGRMSESVEKIIERYPTIEVAIDLHRDGVDESIHLVQEVNGLPTARMMLVEGVAMLDDNGKPKPIPDLANPYVKENLALSLQVQLAANETYPGLMRMIYIKPYRYSLYMLPKSVLVEVGAQNNTVQEARNAMWPLAQILMSVLQEKD